jgi:hypothetical protein
MRIIVSSAIIASLSTMAVAQQRAPIPGTGRATVLPGMTVQPQVPSSIAPSAIPGARANGTSTIAPSTTSETGASIKNISPNADTNLNAGTIAEIAEHPAQAEIYNNAQVAIDNTVSTDDEAARFLEFTNEKVPSFTEQEAKNNGAVYIENVANEAVSRKNSSGEAAQLQDVLEDTAVKQLGQERGNQMMNECLLRKAG